MKNFVGRCWDGGVSKIVAGDLSGIRENADFNKKANSMIHRLKWTAENYLRFEG